MPESAIDKYRTTGSWSKFGTIVSDPPSNGYKLIYFVDGVEQGVEIIEVGVTITPKEEPTKEGYTFSGWSEIPETMPDHDVTVTGSFTVNTYKLSYYVDGQQVLTTGVNYGDQITPLEEPTKEGYTFSGWSDIPETMPANDVNISGSFTVNTYKLSYYVDGQHLLTTGVNYDELITPLEEPTREGYIFSGWSEIPATMPAHDVDITGSFTVNTYKLSYFVDGQHILTTGVNYGDQITPLEEPTKEGYTFSGWSDIPETMPAQDVTITGTFTINTYKLIYAVDGETYKEIEVEYGAEVTAEADLEKEGFTFSGWSEIPETMPAHDVVITGSFTKGTYKLIYMVDGETYKTYSKDYQDAITVEVAPEREGYTFSGWSEIPETMPDHDVTVTGTFTINHYTITFKVGDNVYEAKTLDYGSAIEVPEMPELTGYTFTWGEVPATMPAQDVTIVGVYQPNLYNVTYLINGQFFAIFKVPYGSTITPPDAPEREGSTFTWGDYPETMPAHDITIEGTYTDGIEALQNTQNVEIYTLDGKKVNRMQRGVNIVRQGNKVVKVVR